MRFFCLSFFLILCLSSFAQKPFLFPKIKNEGISVAQLTPIGWTVIQQVTGDLNHDGTDDLVIIFEYSKNIEETRAYGDNTTDIIKENQKPRILAIYLKDKSSPAYHLSTQNNDFILRSEEGAKGNDPLQQIAIKDQQLYLRFKGGSEWRWELGYTFKLEQGDWYLTSAFNLYYNNLSGDMTERVYDFIERRLYTTSGNLYKRAISYERTSEVLLFSQLRTFKSFKKPWAWEIMPNLYL